MADEDLWPKPKYNPGPQKHLHAIGVISTCYNAFEESMFELYRHHPDCLKLPYNLIELYYRSLSEQQRLTALKTVFAEYEKDPSISALVENLIQYFSWCWDVRNKLVHADLPLSFSSTGS